MIKSCYYSTELFTQSDKKHESVSKLIHPLFYPPLLRLSHNSLFTAAMLLISNKFVFGLQIAYANSYMASKVD